jgi:hypothetical protein
MQIAHAQAARGAAKRVAVQQLLKGCPVRAHQVMTAARTNWHRIEVPEVCTMLPAALRDARRASDEFVVYVIENEPLDRALDRSSSDRDRD